MERNDLIVTLTVDDLTCLIRREISNIIKFYIQPPKPELPEKIRLDEAINFLDEIGYKTSKSSLQKLCAERRIPFYKVAGKCIFSRQELKKFVEEHTTKKGGY